MPGANTVNQVINVDYRELKQQDPTVVANAANLRAVLLLGQTFANDRRLVRAGTRG
eukprot:COSAG02_NODE_13437_length_1395_cov_2.564043_1_plen_56_part_00